MKKVLIGVLLVFGVAAIVVVFMGYQMMQSSKLIKELSKYELPSGGFEAYLDANSLKFRMPETGWPKSKKDVAKLPPEPAPLHEVKIQGDRAVSGLASIVKDASKAENVRCAALVILAHISLNTKKQDVIVGALIDGLQEKEGRLGECASIMAQKIDSDAVPNKISEVLKSATDAKVRLNALRGITLWVLEDPKRKRNQVVLEEVVKALDEKDRPTLMMVLQNSKRCQFKFEGKNSLGEQFEKKALPMIAGDDEELAKTAAAAAEWQYSYMSDEQKKDAIKRVAAYASAERKKHVRLNALSLLKKINGELAQNSATIRDCDLDSVMTFLESDDPDFLRPALGILKQCGTMQQHRAAVKAFLERTADGDLKKLADEAIALILKREEGS